MELNIGRLYQLTAKITVIVQDTPSSYNTGDFRITANAYGTTFGNSNVEEITNGVNTYLPPANIDIEIWFY